MEKVSILYAAVQYTCQYMAQVYVLVFKDALSVPSIENNLIPPFIMRESDMEVKNTAEINAMDTSVEDHSIYFPNFDIRITLFLHSVLSYFPKYKPSLVTLEGIYEIYLITPEGRWNPVSDAYKKIY